MSIYLDLSIISHILFTIFAIHFINVVDVRKLKISGYCKFIVFSTPLVLTLYLSKWLSGVIILVSYGLLFFLFFKRDFVLPLIEYLFAYYYLAFISNLISPSVSFVNFTLVIKELKGMLTLLSVPLSFVILKVVAKAVDQLYHLSNYKLKLILKFEGQVKEVKGYFDTGNTLKYKGIPVIFYRRVFFPFHLPSSSETINYETVNGETVTNLYQASVMLDDTRESLVYIALVDGICGFNGCECLLNAYLGV